MYREGIGRYNSDGCICCSWRSGLLDGNGGIVHVVACARSQLQQRASAKQTTQHAHARTLALPIHRSSSLIDVSILATKSVYIDQLAP